MTLRALLAAFALVISATASAATLAERSPFTQGHWWNPARSGSGFELFNVGAESMAIWYTFDQNGLPIWYTAQGALGTDWPLLKHRWTAGRHAGYETVGTLRLNVTTPESAEVAFTIGGASSRQSIEPFIVAVAPNEVDHTGSYYNAANSGWGLTLTQQGDVLGGVLYTYNVDGTPMWYAGFDRGSTGTVNMIQAVGACPYCINSGTTTQGAGSVTFEFASESEMVIRSQLRPAMAAGVNVDGARVRQLGRTASSRPADRQMAAFDSESLLVAYLRDGLRGLLGPTLPGGVDFSAGPAGGSYSFSPTNVQETGVDEADLVKTDGRFVYAYAYGSIGNIPNYRQAAIRRIELGDDGAQVGNSVTFPLSSPADPMLLATAGLYLTPERLVSLTGTSPFISFGFAAWAPSISWARGTTNLEIFTLSGAAVPSSALRVQIEGHLVASRRVGDRVYVVTRFVPDVPGLFSQTYPTYGQFNPEAAASATPAMLIPRVRIDGGGPAPLVEAANVYALPQGSRQPAADMIVVTTIDLAQARVVQSVGVVGSAETVYASSHSLYLAASRAPIRRADGTLLPSVPALLATQVHRLDFVPAGVALAGSGNVEGYLSANIDQAPFRMSESANRLRIVTGLTSGGQNRNLLTIIEPSTVAPGVLKTTAVLPNAQRPEPLGLPLETLRSTRFVGDRLYAVTFGPAFVGAPPVDPLYVVDLSNANDPRITGELVMPGFSSYLHPLPGNVLLGIGYDVNTQNVITALQVSLFDVSDGGRPREMQKVLLGSQRSDSAVIRDHHAFSALLDANGAGTFAFPGRTTSVHNGTTQNPFPLVESGLLRFSITGRGTGARITQLPSLATGTLASPPPQYDDPTAANTARGVLFPKGSIYWAWGRFSHLDNQGRASVGF